MRLIEFGELNIGAKFRLFEVTGLRVITKTSNRQEYSPVDAMYVNNTDCGHCKNEQPVLLLDSAEVVIAEKIEQQFRVSSDVANHAFIYKDNKLYVQVKLMKLELPEDPIRAIFKT